MSARTISAKHRSPRGSGSPGLPAAFVAPLVVSLALVVTGCGSDAGTTSTAGTGTRAAAGGAGLIGECPAGRASTPTTVALENRLDVPVSLWFSQVDCSDWAGRSPVSRTPVYYSPVNLAAGNTMPDGVAGTSIDVDPVYRKGRRPWLTTVQTADGKVVARFRLALTSIGDYDNSQQMLAMWNATRKTFSREPDTFAVLPASLVGGKPAKAVIGAGDTLVLRYDK